MNLWAKSLRQLLILAVALFFFSCEDETGFLGFKNPRPKFNVAYIEIPLPSSVVLLDSVVTDNAATGGINLIGAYNDLLLGNIQARSFFQIYPLSTAKIDASSVYDSVTFQMRLNFYSYGFSGAQHMRFNVHEITGDTLDRYYSKRYYYNSTVGFDPMPLGEARIHVDYDSLKKNQGLQSGRQDTFLLKAKLNDVFGAKLFDIAYNDPNAELSSHKNFIQRVKGLVITPVEENGILGVNPISDFSRVVVHYHTMENGAVKDTLQKSFNFYYSTLALPPSFTNITANRGATELGALSQPYQSFAPVSGFRAVQSGSPVMTKLDLSKFYEFADNDTIDKLIINSAEIVISDVSSDNGTEVHTDLLMKVVNNNNELFTNRRVTANREAMVPYYLYNDTRHYYVNSDAAASTPASLRYNADDDKFSGFVTLFTQSLFNARKKGDAVNADRITYLGINPFNPASGTSVTRSVFNAGNVKLRIYYTVPSNSDSSP
jgi:hypothetical protein